MSGREPESAEFAPERLSTGSRRRIDPLAIGAVVVAAGLVLAIAKPWGGEGELAAVPSASIEAAVAPPSTPPTEPAAEAATPDGATSSSVSVLARGRLATVLGIRHAWGVRAVVRDTREADDDLVERWQPIDAPIDAPSTDDRPVRLADSGAGVMAIGLTFPPDDAPLDVRAWRPTSDGGWEWLDTAPLPRTLNSGLLLPPPRVGEVRATAWPAGLVRLDVLTAAGVARVDVAIPDGRDAVPGPTPATPGDRSLRSPLDPDLGDVAPGQPFAVVDGVGVALAGGPGPALSAQLAWLDPVATSVEAGRTNGLGVTFPVGAAGIDATIARLDPEPTPIATARRVPGLDFAGDARVPYVVFRAPGTSTWTPGTYRLEASWTLDGVRERATFHATLRPGPAAASSDLLVATRLFAPIAGTIDAAGAGTSFEVRSGLDCTGQPDAVVRASRPSPSVIGIGHATDATPSTVRAEMLLDGGRVAAVPLVAVRGALPGLTVIAPADGYPFNSGVHRLYLGDGADAPIRLVCIGVGGPP